MVTLPDNAAVPPDLPLSGVRILEACNVLSGPTATRLLADYGADVIKVEHPQVGDVLRVTGLSREGLGLTNEVVNRNKRSIGLYLGDPEAAAIFRVLARDADVVVENFRPGTLTKWGLDYPTLSAENPGLVLAHVSGFGQSGAYSERAAFGTVAECMSGFAYLVGPMGGEPTLGTFGLADNVAAASAALGVMVALWQRERNGGRGTEVDATLLGPMLGITSAAVAWAQQLGIEVERSGNKSRNSAPRNVYRCADGRWVGLAAQTTSLAQTAVSWAGRPDLVNEPWFTTPKDRAAHGVVDRVVAEKVATLTRDEVVEQCTKLKIPVGEVYSPMDIVEDDDIRGQGLLVEYHHPVLGRLLEPGLAAGLSSMTAPVVRTPAPGIGQHTDEVFTAADIPMETLTALRERGVAR